MDKWKARTAALPPSDPAEQGVSQRNIPKDHPFDPRALKPMAKALWASSVSLGHALTAYRYLSRVKSATVSPDGMLGGRGYVMEVSAMRRKLHEACEILSQVSDTIYDEINGPHWKPKLALLDENEAEDVERFVEESRENLDAPTQDAEKEITEIERENDEPSSEVPTAGQEQGEVEPPTRQKQAARRRRAWFTGMGDATNNPDALSGPRVDHRGPAEGDGPWGSYNRDEPPVQDDWSESEGRWFGEYDYPSEWDNDLHDHQGESALPNDPATPTEGDSFGLGWAEGDAVYDYGSRSPGGGVAGPSSGLPDDPGSGPGRDVTTPGVEYSYERITTPGVERPK